VRNRRIAGSRFQRLLQVRVPIPRDASIYRLKQTGSVENMRATIHHVVVSRKFRGGPDARTLRRSCIAGEPHPVQLHGGQDGNPIRWIATCEPESHRLRILQHQRSASRSREHWYTAYARLHRSPSLCWPEGMHPTRDDSWRI